jgi:diguanylate cyclase
MLRRMRNDLDLATITVFGGVAIVGIAPFAVYRYYTGNMPAAIMDTLIVLGICLALAHAWVSGNTKRAAFFMTLATNLGCIASANLLGLAGLFWTFPVILVNFLLLGHRMALAVSLFTLGFLIWYDKAFESRLELAMFLVSCSVVGLIAFMFAYRTQSQRQALENLTLLDPLTGAQNRRGMDQELEIAVKSFARDGKPYGLAIFDLDHFKHINDKYGHEEGDEVLINFAKIIRTHSRKMDRFFRMGGEEFVLLLPGADMQALRVICNNHCQEIEKSLRCRDETITTSVGAAILLAGEDRQDWLARADASLYAAKNAGRNRVVIDSAG